MTAIDYRPLNVVRSTVLYSTLLCSTLPCSLYKLYLRAVKAVVVLVLVLFRLLLQFEETETEMCCNVLVSYLEAEQSRAEQSSAE